MRGATGVPVYVMIGNIVEANKRAPRGWNGCIRRSIRPRAGLARLRQNGTTSRPRCSISPNRRVRAYKDRGVTPPMAPVLLSLDAELQENPIPDPEGPAPSPGFPG